jgi:D-psicose/D-tagatose/L-ribulose 3-epimerase
VQARELVEDIGLDNVTIHLDTYHMNIEENSMEQAVEAAGDKLGWAHSSGLV